MNFSASISSVKGLQAKASIVKNRNGAHNFTLNCDD